MSYKLTVMKDNPIAFWPLDDLAIKPLLDYESILSEFNTYLEFREAYPTYGNINYIVHDFAGDVNEGNYEGDFGFEPNTFPLVSGGIYPVNIYGDRHFHFNTLKSYDGTTMDSPFGTIYNQSLPFSLEVWIKPNFSSNELTNILGDPTAAVGLFWQDHTVVFNLSFDSVKYYLPYSTKSLHIVGTFDGIKARIYVDSELVIEKNIMKNPFDNDNLILSCGPVLNQSDSFVVDNFAVYGYELSQSQILNHYNDYGYRVPTQIVSTDNGELFDFYDNKTGTVFEYDYPSNKSWENFLNDDLYYDRIENYISLSSTPTSEPKEVIIEDIVILPSGINMDSSRIEWYGENGISVESSVDGITYTECNNRDSIPQYKYGNFDDSRIMYLKIKLSSMDASVYLPRLYNLNISFFNNKIMYSKNGSSYLSKIENFDWSLNKKSYPILSHDSRNGLYIPENSGFQINTSYLVRSVEFFYQSEITKAGKLFSSVIDEDGVASSYSWTDNGTISMTNIKSIYVNGVDKTLENTISDVFSSNLSKHVVLVFENPVYGSLIFNYNNGINDYGLYQYLSLYRQELRSSDIINHYNLYIGNYHDQIHDTRLSISENSISSYNNNWTVIENV